MIVVIQCAASKQPDAGYFRTKDGRRVLFVADPATAPAYSDLVYARPDDRASDGISWREHVARYNATPNENPFELSPAYKLYKNKIYCELVHRFGIDNTMILSAGWGLIPTRFLTPRYDITFSTNAQAYVRRRQSQEYGDFSMLPARANGPIVFFGGRSYVSLFSKLTAQVDEQKFVFYKSADPPIAPGCRLGLSWVSGH